MPGVGTSKRCERCRKRKIKCDEDWPTCGSCLRAKTLCSGPPAISIIPYPVPHGRRSRSSEPGGEGGDNLPSSNRLVGVGVKITPAEPLVKRTLGDVEIGSSQPLIGGATLSCRRLIYDDLPRNPTTVADRVAARLVRFLSDRDASWNFLTTAGYMRLLPSRLNESAALRDCVALACSTWHRFYNSSSGRNQSLQGKADCLVDLKDYGKALRSLRQALNDPELCYSRETLAAVTVLERIEVIFDTNRPVLSINHIVGIENIMLQRGPPSADDELDVQLTYENHATLLNLWVSRGGGQNSNFFLRSPWREALDTIKRHTACDATIGSERRNRYVLGSFYAHWPDFVRAVRAVPDGRGTERLEAAITVYQQIYTLDQEFQATGEDIVQGLVNACRIRRVPDTATSTSPLDEQFHFESLDAMLCLCDYLMLRCILNRMMQYLAGITETESASSANRPLLPTTVDILETEYRQMCRELWMCLPTVRKLGFVAMLFFLTPLYLSYEGGNAAERDHVFSYIIEVVRYKGRLPSDREAVEKFLISVVDTWVGR